MHLTLIPNPHPTPPTEASLHAELTAAGLDVFRWSDFPDATYTPHHHDHDETICLVAGELTFTVDATDFTLRAPGDRLLLPAGTVHSARAGASGATYLIAS